MWVLLEKFVVGGCSGQRDSVVFTSAAKAPSIEDDENERGRLGRHEDRNLPGI